MAKTTVVTTSWDDGDRRDLRVAELLRSRNLSGTFYVPIAPYRGRPALSHAELRSLSSNGLEIGAHGFSHKLLWRLPAQELAREVNPCKSALEDIIGTRVRMFCYPRGRYDSNVIQAVKKAGYCGARTVRLLATRSDFSPFEIPTTVQVFPHTKFSYIKNIIRTRKIESLQVCLTNRRWLGNWIQLGQRLFDSVLQNGGIWHLWGHSWEIDELGLWEELGELLDYVCNRRGVTYLSNGELLTARLEHTISRK